MRRTLLASLLVLLLMTAAATSHAADRIETVAGSGSGGFGGDGVLATMALLTSPSDVAPVGDSYLIADTSNSRIRRVNEAGVIGTVAGAGPCCGTTEPFAGDGRPATDPAVRLNQPRGVSPTPDGGFLIADTGNNRIRRVSAAGVITTVAGGGTPSGGEGSPAVATALNQPGGVAALPDGSYLIADTGSNRIRRVDPDGRIFTVAGGGPAGIGIGDGGAANRAVLSAPARVVPLTGGGYLIADTGNNRIRRVDANGIITTVAGNGSAGFSGDGGPATAAALNQPEGVSVRADGAIAIADSTNERIREVDATGTIRTIAGTGTLGLSGDGGLPTAAQLSHPRAVAHSAGRLRIADAFNHRVRAIVTVQDPVDPPPSRDPDPEPPRRTPPGVSPAVTGRSTVVAPVSGTILIRLPGTRRFVRLREIANVPIGSELDATRGRVSLLFATTNGADPTKASVIASGGRFVVRQPRRLDLGQRPGSLALSGPLAGCTAPLRRGAARGPLAGASAKKRKRKGRRVRVHAQGRIEVSGRYGAAIVRGTRWTTIDRCPRDPRPGTLFVVQEGKVAVTAFLLRRRTLVSRGRRYLAPARRPASAGRARARARRP
jgi:hypothetical protein